ncbi:MAG: NifU family protein [Chloroflexi bacterium]|nr:NifU family protein [Chloroflexota bacterium]
MNQENKEYTLEDRLRGLIDQLDAYIDHYHGGSVQFVSLNDNIVTVRLGGACEGCSLKTATLKGWVEGTITQFFPEIISVELEA